MIGFLNANALQIPLADNSVQMVATSPPYYGLRDYKTRRWEGGDPECDHVAGEIRTRVGLEKWSAEYGRGGAHAIPEKLQFKGVCGKCGALRIDEQLGLEPTPEEYVANLVAVFRELRRVLRDDGVVFLNLGDSYAGSHGTTTVNEEVWASDRRTFRTGEARFPIGFKPKDLIGIPWRVAFALQADGWWLRSDIIWAKPNPMPESVTDRPTKAHEYVFLLTKSQKYYWDQNGVREEQKLESKLRVSRGWNGNGERDYPNGPQNHMKKYMGKPLDEALALPGRNIRTVWTIATAPYKGAHFATWPPKLVEPMIKAGSRVGDVVLDPFAGSGTTLMVARQLGRSAIGLDLSFTYLKENATKRLELDKMKAWVVAA